MRIVHTYLLREFFAAFVLSLLILTFVMILGNIVYLVGLIVTKGIPATIIMKLFLSTLPYFLQFVLPISIMAGLLLSLGRLSSDNEIISIRASGMSTFKLVFPFLILGCKYARVGSGETLGTNDADSQKLEAQALTAILCKLTSGKPTSICSPLKDQISQIP